MELETSFGRWLRARRRALDLTQDELARRVGCSVFTIRKIEADERRPSRQIAERLADSLQVASNDRAAIITLARAEPYLDTTPAQTPGQPLCPPQQPPTNLPAPLTRLIGRNQDIAAARNALLHGEVRLLTLLGPPGIGKTSLSLAVAREIHDAFTDRAHFVALAPLSDPSLVLATIAQTLGVKETAGQPLLERLKVALHTKRLLLLLDNFEHLLDAAPLVVDLLEACPGLKALVTSRAALHVRGERLYAVPPLLLPNLTQRPPSVMLGRTPAVALFVERAQAVLPHFRLTEQNAAAVAAICVRLDGLPLAIELAATRIRHFPPEGLLARLEQRLSLLTDGARDLPPRHRTLRAAIGWSYELLSAGEQTLFARLGVFVGGWTLAAAEVICGGWGMGGGDRDNAAPTPNPHPPSPILDGLAALLDKSLLKQEEGVAGEPRLTMLETIREYALERLAAHGETEALRRRHADYYLALAEAAEPQLFGPDQVAWIDRLEAEHNNLRAALAWGCTAQDAEALAQRLAGAISWFWVIHSHFSEGHLWLNAMLDRSNMAAPAVRAKTLRAAAMLAENHGEFARSIALLEESLALYRDLGNTAGAAQALLFLGRIRGWQGAYAQARSLLSESLALSQAQQNTWMSLIWSLMSLGDTAFYNTELLQAQEYFQQALALSSDRGDLFASAWARANLGQVAHALGDDSQAQTYYAQSLASFRHLGQRRDVAEVYLDLARVARTQGHAAQAHGYYAESLTVFGEVMDKRGIPECLEGIAGLASAAAQHPEGARRAARLFGAAESWREAAGLPLPPVHRAAYAHDLAATRAQLDELEWGRAWAAGRGLSMEQAIAEAQQALLEAEATAAVHQPEPPPASRSTKRADELAGTLTPRERQVLAMLAQGASNRAIAEKLIIAERTAEIHVSNILGKLGVTSRTQAAAYALAQGLAAPLDA